MEVLGNATLPKQGCRSVLASINNDTGETELVAIAWVDRNRRFFITTTCGLGEGEMIQRKRLRQLDKSGRAPPDKVIIEVASPWEELLDSLAPTTQNPEQNYYFTIVRYYIILPTLLSII